MAWRGEEQGTRKGGWEKADGRRERRWRRTGERGGDDERRHPPAGAVTYSQKLVDDEVKGQRVQRLGLRGKQSA